MSEDSDNLLEAGGPTEIMGSDNHSSDSLPKSVFFIIGNEFCERFSYYGMRAILWTYLAQFLRFPDGMATSIYHSFVMLAYFFPLFGAILADSYWGKYRTILTLSIVYIIGNIVMAVTAFPSVAGNPPQPYGALIGLLLLAIGTGGIKPCVVSFGGDQFDASQVKQSALFFSLFYFSINAGSFFSMIITPWIRENVQCFGSDQCFPLAFGLPAILLIVATCLFVIGSKSYKHRPLSGNVSILMFNVVKTAIKERRKRKREESEAELPNHWLYYAYPLFDRKTIDEIKSVFSVLIIFAPLSVFWMIYDQQGSRWTAQVWQMNHKASIFGSTISIPPESMQVWNTVFILIMIPLFQKLIFPAVRKFGIKLTALRKIGAGLIIALVAFLMSAYLQFEIDNTMTGPRLSDASQCNDNCISILWQIPQYIVLTCGEVLVSITGLEFAYSQAPSSMKSICQSGWLLAIALGNLLVILFNLFDPIGNIPHHEMWTSVMYSGILVLAILLYIRICKNYKYKSASNEGYVSVPDEEIEEAT